MPGPHGTPARERASNARAGHGAAAPSQCSTLQAALETLSSGPGQRELHVIAKGILHRATGDTFAVELPASGRHVKGEGVQHPRPKPAHAEHCIIARRVAVALLDPAHMLPYSRPPSAKASRCTTRKRAARDTCCMSQISARSPSSHRWVRKSTAEACTPGPRKSFRTTFEQTKNNLNHKSTL